MNEFEIVTPGYHVLTWGDVLQGITPQIMFLIQIGGIIFISYVLMNLYYRSHKNANPHVIGFFDGLAGIYAILFLVFSIIYQFNLEI